MKRLSMWICNTHNIRSIGPHPSPVAACR